MFSVDFVPKKKLAVLPAIEINLQILAHHDYIGLRLPPEHASAPGMR